MKLCHFLLQFGNYLVCGVKFLESIAKNFFICFYFFIFVLKDIIEELQLIEESFWSYFHSSTFIEKVLWAQLNAVFICVSTQIYERFPLFISLDAHICNVFFSNSQKCLFTPALEPVNSTAVDQAWEFSGSHSEAISSRTHAQNNMQIRSNAGDKMRPNWLRAIYLFGLDGMRSNPIYDIIDFFFFLKEVRNFSSIEHVVNTLKELFINNLSI